MIYSELRFLLFFGLVFLVHWSLRSAKLRKVWLLVASYAFYAGWDWRFLSLILFSTGVDYLAGSAIAKAPKENRLRRKTWLGISLTVNLGLLGFFKYYNFFVESAADFSSWLGFPVSDMTLGIILPVGISFYTFQTLSYTLDIYRGKMGSTKSLLDFALFVGFFPQLIAGPIVRAIDFLPQLETPRLFSRVDVRAALLVFLFGFVKKTCVADNLSVAVDLVWKAPEAFNLASHWLAGALYSVQLYCDFSGYSDMALGTAALLGYHLPVNFTFPYMRRSLTDLWRSWHITMTGWFRDYIYNPIGGNRGGKLFTARNTFIVFAVTGIWHGAAWTFIVWGLLHGVLVIIESRTIGSDGKGRGIWGLIYANVLWILTFTIFRAPDLGAAGSFLLGYVTPGGDQTLGLPWLLLLIGFAAVHAWMFSGKLDQGLRRLPAPTFALVYGAMVALALPWAAGDVQPFIYFQF